MKKAVEQNTTERFFIVRDGSSLSRQYTTYQAFVDLSVKVFHAFAEDVGMDVTTKFYPDPDQLGIVPVGKDEETFEPYFTKAVHDGGLRLFRKNSIINHQWQRAAQKADLQFVRRPSPTWDLGLSLRGSFRLFDHNGVLYLSLDIPADLGAEVHADLTEIKGSEFWKVIEDIEEEANCDGN